jgi:hypothetical protein
MTFPSTTIRDDPPSWEAFRASLGEWVQWVRMVLTVDMNTDVEAVVKYKSVDCVEMDWVTLEV